MISIFCNVELNLLDKLTYQDFQDISNILINTLNQEPKFKNRFYYDGVEYGFIPNLEKMSLGEYVDIDNAFKEQDYNSFLQVVYRPITRKVKDKYEIEPYNVDNLKDMTNVPFDIYKGAEVFFYTLGKDLLNAMKNYLQTQEIAITKVQRNTQSLVINGVGINQLTNLLTEIYEHLTMLQKSKLIKPLRICAL